MEAEVLGTVAATTTTEVETSEGFRVGPFDDPDRYEIGEPVEAGAEGILYRGRLITPTSRLTLSVAVKALQPAYASRIDQWAARWRDQVELLRTLQIPGLVGVREGFVGPLPHRQGADTAGRNLYLVMNWVEGEALDHWVLRHRGVDVNNALKLLLPVAVAVDTMHAGQLTGSVPVVHRDIKPANILIGKGGSVLVDFGLTKGLSVGRPVGRAGTPGYIAPEVVAGGGYTPAADRYAFGATVFFLLTGRHPSAASSLADLRRLLETAPIAGGVAPELVDRVVAMLDPDPERRPGALANWIAQLRQSSLDDEVLTVRLPPPAPARPRRSRGDGSGAGSATGSGAGSALSGGVGMARTGGSSGSRWGTDVRVTGASGPRSPLAVGAASTGTIGGTWGVGADTGYTGLDEFEMSGESGSTGFEADGHRRGGAHRAPHRAPQHARRQRALTGRYAMAVVAAVAFTLIASDTGAIARTARRVSVGSAPNPSRSTGGSTVSVTPPSAHLAGRNATGGLDPLSLAPEASTVNSKTGPGAATTTVLPPANCVRSYVANCGPLVWSPPVVNQPLTVSFTYSPQHPLPGDLVTFTITLADPDDGSNLLVNGSYFGDSTSPAGGMATAPSNLGGAGCRTPHGSWPPPPATGGQRVVQVTHIYGSPGPYLVHFVASSGLNNGPCGFPDPYASNAIGADQTVLIQSPAPPPTTVAPPPTTTIPPPTTVPVTTTTPVTSAPKVG